MGLTYNNSVNRTPKPLRGFATGYFKRYVRETPEDDEHLHHSFVIS